MTSISSSDDNEEDFTLTNQSNDSNEEDSNSSSSQHRQRRQQQSKKPKSKNTKNILNNNNSNSSSSKKKSSTNTSSKIKKVISDSEVDSENSNLSYKAAPATRSKNTTASNRIKYSSDEDNNNDEDEDNDDSYDCESDDNTTENSESDEESEDDDDDDKDDEDYFEYRRSKRISQSKKRSSVKQKNNAKKNTKNLRSSRPSKTNSQERRSTTSKKINYCEESDQDDQSDYDELDESQSSYIVNQDTKEDDPNVETIEKVLKYRYGKVGAIGSKTAVYNVEENGDPNEVTNTDGSDVQYEHQYLIKWTNWSHLHNTWESKESLLQQKVKGMKKLENFLKKEEESRQLRLEAKSPEDIEYLECQSEMLDNLLETHKNVERIISHDYKNSDGQTSDYLCKWQGLPYSDCTWEDGELIKKRAPKLIEEYERRYNSQELPPINVKSQKALRVRPRFVALKEKPDYFGANDPDLKLRDYQLDGLNWLANSWCKQNSIILADEMGLGKTIQSISFISYVFNEHHLYGPFLVVIPLSTIQGWQREFQKWSPEINVVIYLGDIQSRTMIQKYEWHSDNKKIKCNVILTTYEILLKDKSFFSSVSWAALVVDEAHRLKNEDSLLYRTLLNFDTNHRLLITGTPLQNSLKELWALLHFIMPEKFYSWEEFDVKYSSVLSDGLRFQDLHKELQPYLLRRVKKDVEKSLPAKVEQILRVEMTKIQKQYYKLILTKNYKELSKGAKGSVSSFLNIMMELKKCSNHIYLIRRDEHGGSLSNDDLEKLIKGSGKLLLLDKLLRRLKETGHRVLIFSQMVRMLDILAEYLQYRRFPFQRLDGSIKGEVRLQALDHFNKPDSEDFCFLLSTRAGGLGINLATADTVIIYDSDWNPQNDLQAQARAHRIGQKNQVNIYRLVSKNSIEEDIVERAKQKMVLDHLVIQRMDTTGRTVLNKTNIPGNSTSIPFSKDEINSILKFGAEELFKEKDNNATNEEEKDEREEQQLYDIDEILKRAETREEANHLSASEELLSQFKVANFSTIEDDPIVPNNSLANNQATKNNLDDKSWNDIIPESERQKVELEEENEKLKQINLALESRRNRGNQLKKSKNNQNRSDDEASMKSASDDSMDSSDVDQHKKSKKKNKNDHVIKGLNAQEVRRFVRSYRKFPCPLAKIDTIAQDSNLEEKSQACLLEFANKMQNLAKIAISEYENNHKNTEEHEADQNDTKKKREKGPSFTLNGVKLYAQQVLDADKYFEPLSYYFQSLSDPKQFQFKTKLKQTYWDCEWTEEDDKSLLLGIYEYGYGNWEWIKADAHLNLTNKILISDDKKKNPGEERPPTSSSSSKLKPQSKHLRTRIDYLLKVLQNQINTEKYGAGWKSDAALNSNFKFNKKNKTVKKTDDPSTNTNNDSKSTKTEHNSRTQRSNSDHSSQIRSNKKKSEIEMTNNNDNNSLSNNGGGNNSGVHSNNGNSNHHHHQAGNSQHASSNPSRDVNKSKRKVRHHHQHHHKDGTDSNDSDNSESNSDTKKKRNNSGDDSNYNHHKNLDNDDSDFESGKKGATGDKKNSKDKKVILSEKTFNECKNIMRPVKKALKNIDLKEINMSEKDQLERTKRYLLEIGDKINDHLTMYSDPDKIKEWRNYLWIFVSKFTTWNPERLKNLYKKFVNSRDEEDFNKPKNSYSHDHFPASSSSSQQHFYSNSYRYDNKKDQSQSSKMNDKKYDSKQYDKWKSEKNDKNKEGARTGSKSRDHYGSRRDMDNWENNDHKNRNIPIKNHEYPDQSFVQNPFYYPKPYNLNNSYDYPMSQSSNENHTMYDEPPFINNEDPYHRFHPNMNSHVNHLPFMPNTFNDFNNHNYLVPAGSPFQFPQRKPSMTHPIMSPSIHNIHEHRKPIKNQPIEMASKSPLSSTSSPYSSSSSKKKDYDSPTTSSSSRPASKKLATEASIDKKQLDSPHSSSASSSVNSANTSSSILPTKTSLKPTCSKNV